MISKIRRGKRGGTGSGRDDYGTPKGLVDDYCSIDVRRWKREDLLSPFQIFRWQWFHQGQVFGSMRVHSEPDSLTLTYRYPSGYARNNRCQTIALDWSKCHIGGRRPWFLCPTPDCGRRVAILYFDGVFACRHCHRLTYPSQRETFYL